MKLMQQMLKPKKRQPKLKVIKLKQKPLKLRKKPMLLKKLLTRKVPKSLRDSGQMVTQRPKGRPRRRWYDNLVNEDLLINNHLRLSSSYMCIV